MSLFRRRKPSPPPVAPAPTPPARPAPESEVPGYRAPGARPVSAAPTVAPPASAPAPSGPLFAPDPPSPPEVHVPVPEDPAAALAALGVVLPAPAEPVSAIRGLTVWSVAVEPDPTAVDLWLAVRDLHPRTGLWPLLVDAEMLDQIGPDWHEDPPPPPPVAGDAAAWFQQQWTSYYSDKVDRGPGAPAWSPGADWAAGVVNELGLVPPLPDAAPERPGPQVWLVLVPASAGWLVPGLLAWGGGVNAEVMGDEHASVLRRWAATYGAELVGLTGATLTLRVLRPPQTDDDALGSAVEAFLYCPDAVWQGTETLDALADRQRSAHWSYWWD